jgi:CGNR zinc finger protein
MRSIGSSSKSEDVKWLEWLVERIGPLGSGQVDESYVVPGNPPKLVKAPTGPWPFKSQAKVDSFRPDLGRFAAQYAPHLVRRVRSGEWKPSLETTQRVLERLPGVYSWARNAGLVMLSGQIVMYLDKDDRTGRPVVGFVHDPAFDFVRAFVDLSSRYIGRFRSCPSAGCGRTFVARRRDQLFCSKTCAVRKRVAAHRKRRRQSRPVRRSVPRR